MHVYIHIGVHKTGTSAIQAALTRNKMALRERGVWYEPYDEHENHTLLAMAFQREMPSAANMVAGYLRAASDAGLDRCIISSEAFSEPPLPMEALKSALQGVDTTVVAYIRRPDEIMLAAYNQLVRVDYTRWATKVTERAPYDPTYYAPLGPWMSWNLVLAPYDPAQWRDGNIVADFLSMVGVDHSGMDLEGVANRSLPPALIEVLRLANATTLDGPEREAFIASLFDAWDRHPDMFDHGSLITDDERREYCDRLQSVMPMYMQFLRPGFDTSFLSFDQAATQGTGAARED